ncbi:hypothetical protein [Clostridium sp. LIBA-8841]|uniref:hypothetical protein n=1 Tax=Clostridium sp. LIBA-8841 TaxID=2987530 RepID=UPI002AC43B2B|nr:hypothetical protein [Clostridium sp. LIBA-8841]MDZ5255203.1 hypothetical protein [Clostridium sp. LIBA-8841]
MQEKISRLTKITKILLILTLILNTITLITNFKNGFTISSLISCVIDYIVIGLIYYVIKENK